jgi:isopenicillin-N N-acyltransferase-like protein
MSPAIAAHVSREPSPGDRGRSFGLRFADRIRSGFELYLQLFQVTAGTDRRRALQLGEDAVDALTRWAPALALELEGISAGARLPVGVTGALSARTEILALGPTGVPECSVAVTLGRRGEAMRAVQTWDWHDQMRDHWLIWTIEHPGGPTVETLTEYGIVGKIGVSSTGVGVLFNMLKHADDGGPIGIPVHAICRRILDEATCLGEAVSLAESAPVSASSAITVVSSASGESAAATLELYPGGPARIVPDAHGVLVHTNHFLSPSAAPGDALAPDERLGSEIRYQTVDERLREGQAATPAVLVSHRDGIGSLCRHADPAAPLGKRTATLATVVLDLPARAMTIAAGSPCEHSAPARPSQREPDATIPPARRS